MIDYDDTGYTIRRDGAIKKRYTRTPADGKHKVQGADAHVLLAVDDIENLIGMEE